MLIRDGDLGLIRDGDLGVGGGGGGEGGERVKARPRAPTRKTEKVVDRRQNNSKLLIVSNLFLRPVNQYGYIKAIHI